MNDGAEPASARPNRLLRRPDFLAAAGGRRFHTERLSAQARLREPGEIRGGAPADGLHVGFTLTKRVGHATERNRIRRRLRRAIEVAAPGSIAVDADVVVIGRRPALSAPFETLVDDLRRALAVVTKTRGPKPAAPPGVASSGARAPGSAHLPRRGKARKAPDEPSNAHSRTNATHGSTDG